MEPHIPGHKLHTRVAPCPPLPNVPSSEWLVTGFFRDSQGIVYDLKMEEETEPLSASRRPPRVATQREVAPVDCRRPLANLELALRCQALSLSLRLTHCKWPGHVIRTISV